MKTRHEATWAGLAVIGAALIWLGLGLLVFYVPRVLFYWSEAGMSLSPAQKLLVALTGFVDRHSMSYLPALLIGTGAALWWRVQAVRRARAA
jgi:type II secretory pathway component PulF